MTDDDVPVDEELQWAYDNNINGLKDMLDAAMASPTVKRPRHRRDTVSPTDTPES